ncbi:MULTISPECIES: hypothetical protein [Roseomonadaceae]|uniref:Uncharacterized protein n=1 Tax=Falsiroseomonas oleicola TaxID=2801474 RepID=A0ABS6H3Z7_9PROT|nr:hypothetical protein [Roseomonas oleicola]MBU8542562.1 hypothetical protein [Roseomonas oleicola]
MPTWLAAVAQRLHFMARRRRGRRRAGRRLAAVLALLRQQAAGPDGQAAVLERFLQACLDLLEPRPGLAVPLALARDALAGDRTALRRLETLEPDPGADYWAACVPARIAWLEAVAREVLAEQGAAAAMLVNDLAATGRDLPLRALEAAARAGGVSAPAIPSAARAPAPSPPPPRNS